MSVREIGDSLGVRGDVIERAGCVNSDAVGKAKSTRWEWEHRKTWSPCRLTFVLPRGLRDENV